MSEGNLIELGELNFDVEDNTGDYEPVPPGDYVAVIKNSEIKTASNGSDRYLKVCWEIIEGGHTGRLIWEHFNLWYGLERSPSDPKRAELIREIATKNFVKLCKCAGFTKTPSSSSELHGIPMIIKVAVDMGNEQFGKTNKVKRYKPYSEGVASVETVVASKQTTEAPKASSALPWE